MSRPFHAALIAIGLLAGCADRQVLKPVELLDERTGMSVAALQEPLELVQEQIPGVGRRSSFAYLGPVEWNRMGDIRNGLWLHLAPGGDTPFADIRAASAVTLILDDGALELSPIDAPSLGREPYRPAVPWGQTAYFDLSVDNLKHLAASHHLALRCRAADGSSVLLEGTRDPQPILGAYLQSRGLTGD
jgi:hypothetical protein